MNAKLCFPIAFVLTLAGCSSSKPPESQTAQPQHRFQAKETDVTVNGKKAVELSRPQSADTTKPQILSADILPGRGMNIFKIKAFVPGKGVITRLSAHPSIRRPNSSTADLPTSTARL